MRRVTTVLLTLVGILLAGSHHVRASQQEQSKHTIVPGVRVGDYTLDTSKDDVLKKLGEPEAIQLGGDKVNVVRRGDERYSLNNLPREYILTFGNISLWIEGDSVDAISVRSPLYKLSNGLVVGDSEQKIKQAFGGDFHSREVMGKDYLCYKARGLAFEIHEKNQTVTEIVVYEPEGDRGDSAAPESVKVIMLGEQPPGPITFPKINRKPKPAGWRRGEMKSLPKYDPDSGDLWQVDLRCYDLSKLDLRNSIENLMYAEFDHGTVWPAPNRMPPDFDWQEIMELGKNPGLGVRTPFTKEVLREKVWALLL